ncbi:MAG: hypothetical protein B7Z10_13305, partial [Rhodobacterales bacterium 32-66-7]
LEELGKLGDPDQDNISFCIIKLNDASVREKGLRKASSGTVSRPRRVVSAPTLVLTPTPVAEPDPAVAPVVELVAPDATADAPAAEVTPPDPDADALQLEELAEAVAEEPAPTLH